MAIDHTLSITEFRSETGPILDTRSPGEFEKGHIPGGLSFPVFSDIERARVGTCYKQKGRDAAVELGLELVGPRLSEIVRSARKIAPDKRVRIHCARGGLRSRSVGWLLKTAGFDVSILANGYKNYRKWVIGTNSTKRALNVLCGLTGSGKTLILNELERQGEQVLDLEGLANHRGSSFGGLGMNSQPKTQQFENLVAEKLDGFDPSKPTWIEAESSRIGTCVVPGELLAMMQTAPAIEIVRNTEERLDILFQMYGGSDKEKLIEATNRISRNLGGERTKAAIERIRNNDIREACRVILDYYDRAYNGYLERRKITPPQLGIVGLKDEEAAKKLIKNASRLLAQHSEAVAMG